MKSKVKFVSRQKNFKKSKARKIKSQLNFFANINNSIKFHYSLVIMLFIFSINISIEYFKFESKEIGA